MQKQANSQTYTKADISHFHMMFSFRFCVTENGLNDSRPYIRSIRLVFDMKLHTILLYVLTAQMMHLGSRSAWLMYLQL